MSFFDRREISIVLLATFGILQLAEYYYVDAGLKAIAGTARNWGVLIAAIAVGVATLTLFLQYLYSVRRRGDGWIYSLWASILLVITIVVGLLPPLGANQYITWLYDTIFQPVAATLYALLAFYICSAAFRAFKARTKESTVMLVCAVLVIFRNMPMATATWTGFGTIGNWLFDVPAKGGERAILIGAALGIILMGLSAFVGREKALTGGAGPGGGA